MDVEIPVLGTAGEVAGVQTDPLARLPSAPHATPAKTAAPRDDGLSLDDLASERELSGGRSGTRCSKRPRGQRSTAVPSTGYSSCAWGGG